MTSNSSTVPKTGPEGDRTAPKASLALQWAYGYRSANCRSNVHLTAKGELVYFTAAVAIVRNISEKGNNQQRFFLGHDDDIISSCLHPNQITVATAQIGKNARICIWNSQEAMKLESLLQGHTDAVAAMCFSQDGEKLASVGMDNENTIKVWQWRRGKVLATVSGHSDRIFDIFYLGDRVVTCGVKHIRFWTLLGNTLQFKEGNFLKSEKQILLCLGSVGSTSTGQPEVFDEEETVCFTGTLNGDLIIWKKFKLERTISAHSEAIYSININPSGFLTSSKDGTVKGWTRDFAVTECDVRIPSLLNDNEEVCVCSVTSQNNYCVVGTRDCEIYGFQTNSVDQPELLVQGHSDNSLSALACHPRENMFATGGDDCSLRFWNADRMVAITFYMTPYIPLSPTPAIRSLKFSSDGGQIAVGYENGYIELYPTPQPGHSEHRVQPIQTFHDRNDRIQTLAFSPHDRYLAAGCVDGNLDIYDVKDAFKRLRFKNSANSASVTSIDWTEDEQFLQYTGEHKEAFVVSLSTMDTVPTSDAGKIRNWATFTSFKDPRVLGIWNKFADKTDILTIDANFDMGVIAAGDELGLVKLFRFPSERRGAHFKKYVGHSSRLASVAFLHDHSRLITIGTDDRTILQWTFRSESDSMAVVDARLTSAAPMASRARIGPEPAFDESDEAMEEAQALESAHHADAFRDSDSEDSDSDLSGAEIDSDIEKEKQASYDRTLYREDYQKLKKTMKERLPPGEKRNRQPDEGLTLEHVFGYRGYDCRDNVFCLKSKEIVYHVAALGIVLNTDTNQQRFYNQHTDDILCLAVSQDMSLVATGQIGRDPPIHVWNPITMETSSILKGQHFRGICALGFSRNGKRLATVGLDDYHTIVIWDWKRGEKLAAQRGHNEKIFCLRWNPYDDDKFVTVGVKHIKFWTQAGGGMTSKQGVFGQAGGKQGKQNQMCVVYGQNVDICMTGGGDGRIYIWKQTRLEKAVAAHTGPMFAIAAVQDKGYITGGKDSKVVLWDQNFKMLKTYELVNEKLAADSRGRLTGAKSSIRAVTLAGRIYVGTGGGEICEVEKSGTIRVVVQGHAEGELWGLCTHPTRNEICTASDDKTVRIWSLNDRQMLRCATFDKLLRACEYSQRGETVAVGTKDGKVLVLSEATLQVVHELDHRNQEVSDIKFSPDYRHMAVGTHDNFVDIYNVETRKRVGICKANSSYITHIDWEAEGKLLMTNSGAKEQLFYEAPRGTRITSIKTTDIEKMNWATWTGVLGLVCEGIWRPESDITDVNATHLTRDKTTLATGDDFGEVKLFHFPVKGKHAKYKKYIGHSAHVTRVRWTVNDDSLVSIGGRDVAIIVWRHGEGKMADTAPSLPMRTTVTGARALPPSASAPLRKQEHGESEDSDNTDSEEEGYDSDVQHDRDMDYNARILISADRSKQGKKDVPRPTATGNRRPLHLKVKPSQRKIKEELELVKVAMKTGLTFGLLNSMQPRSNLNDVFDHEIRPQGRVTDLELDHIHGYRGFDCRDNLFYLADNESIVYPAAGAGVIHHIGLGTQKFYLKHTDDIISMAVHNGEKYKNIVASGQIGENPTIHVWNPQTQQTLSVLSGKHKRGVCSLSFSASGKLLLSVGVDAPFTIAVWRWEEGVNVACTVASDHRIFRALFHPTLETHFVSVGVKHLKFWSVAGNTLVQKKAVIKQTDDGKRSSKMQTMLSIAFGPGERTYTGSMTGLVLIWQKNVLERTVKAHLGPILSMFSSDNCLVTGSKEKRSMSSKRELMPLKVWNYNMDDVRPMVVEDTSISTVCIRSVCRNAQGKILVGLKTSDILEVDEKFPRAKPKSLVFGHGEGQLWGLAPHPTEMMFATGSYDRNLVVWNISTKGLVAKRDMGKEIRSVAFDSDGTLIAVGCKDGQISLVTFSAEEKKLIDVHKTRERSAPILCIKFSPNRKYLVASSENSCLDFFEINHDLLESAGSEANPDKLRRVGYVTRIEDAVLQIDWSTNSQYIRATTVGFQAHIFKAPLGEELKNSEEIEKIVWNTWTSTLGDDIIGIWPKDVKKDHINCAHATSSTIATGDDQGAVKLFKFPCPEAGAKYKAFFGHSDNVTNVRFLANEQYLVSLGGDDCCIFLWKCLTTARDDDDED